MSKFFSGCEKEAIESLGGVSRLVYADDYDGKRLKVICQCFTVDRGRMYGLIRFEYISKYSNPRTNRRSFSRYRIEDLGSLTLKLVLQLSIN